MKNTPLIIALVCALPITASHATDFFATENFKSSGHLTLATDYRWRGISMSQNQPAIQGGLELSHKSGLYAGVFASSTDVANGASIEADYMLGYRHHFGNNSLSFQYIDINYPGAEDVFHADFEEYSIAFERSSSLKNKDHFRSSIAFSPNYYDHSGQMWRFDARYDFPLNEKIGLLAAVGTTKLEDNAAFFKVWGNDQKDQYYDWKVGLTSTLFKLNSELYYADNSTVNPHVDSMGPRWVFAVSKAF